MDISNKKKKKLINPITSRNKYPLSDLSQTLLNLIPIGFFVWIIGFLITAGLNRLIPILLKTNQTVNFGISLNNSNLSLYTSAFMITGKWIFILSIIGYFACVFLRRTLYYEFSIIKNDFESRRIKRKAIEAFGLNDIEKTVDNGNGKREPKFKGDDKKGAQIVKDMKVDVHSRQEINGDNFYKEILVSIKHSNKLNIQKVVDNYLKELPDKLNRITLNEMAFSTATDDGQGKNDIFIATKELDYNEIAKKLHMDTLDSEEEWEGSQWAMPLSLFEDRTAKIEEETKRAENFGQQFEKNISRYLSTNKNSATLKSINVGSTSVMYTYTLPETGKVQTKTIEEDLETVTKTQGISAKLDAGDLSIIVSLPQEYRITMDFVDMLTSVF